MVFGKLVFLDRLAFGRHMAHYISWLVDYAVWCILNPRVSYPPQPQQGTTSTTDSRTYVLYTKRTDSFRELPFLFRTKLHIVGLALRKGTEEFLEVQCPHIWRSTYSSLACRSVPQIAVARRHSSKRLLKCIIE